MSDKKTGHGEFEGLFYDDQSFDLEKKYDKKTIFIGAAFGVCIVIIAALSFALLNCHHA